MPNVRIKKINPIAGRCIETILGTVRCPVCENQMCIEVSNVGDHQSSARFIYHEKLGGGYCPGSEINVEKLQSMMEVIIGIQNLGFVIADIIDHDPAGKEQVIIAYLPGKALYVSINVDNGEFITAGIDGQLRRWTLVDSREFTDRWSMKEKFQMTCWTTRIKEMYIHIGEQGIFTWDSFSSISFDEWARVVEEFVEMHQEDLAKCFHCDFIVFCLARHCPSCKDNKSYTKEEATVINKSVADKLPKTMFSGNTRLITKVR